MIAWRTLAREAKKLDAAIKQLDKAVTELRKGFDPIDWYFWVSSLVFSFFILLLCLLATWRGAL
ncbi:MAG: hypothetical protein AAF442_05330 [Pseudomonadota bacterium]